MKNNYKKEAEEYLKNLKTCDDMVIIKYWIEDFCRHLTKKQEDKGCCDGCYDVDYDKGFPEDKAIPFCTDTNCKCHSKPHQVIEEIELVELFDKNGHVKEYAMGKVQRKMNEVINKLNNK